MGERISAAAVTVSDTRKAADDLSGDRLCELMVADGIEVADRRIISDEPDAISAILVELAESGVDLIITTGGTGSAPRDNTPEATLRVIEKETPGISEALRRETAARHPMAMLSRGVSGIRGNTLIINFPGSPRGVEEYYDVLRPVLRHAIELIRGNTGH
ncbi:MAG: MogA/MoaB family molybdenum cofactor biosynthesis protein [Acidobacteriota bacterium]|nr:MAG: MogA/MoaB family molybdenum cofactor biosynthesis protein [Acidobacteriota bacterium]